MPPFCHSQGEHVTADAYVSLLEGNVIRQIDAITEGAPYVFQQDLATARAAKKTSELLKAEGVKVLPWVTAGADLNPLDVFANNAVKGAIKKKDVSAVN